MLAVGLPMVFLYFLSILLVGRIAKKKRRQTLRVETKQN
jgi:Sec-independent protein secretion pathway component TatC